MHEEFEATAIASLSAADIHDVMRLVREVCDRWDDPLLWRRHLLMELCIVLQGNVGSMSGQILSPLGSFEGSAVSLAVTGMSDEHRQALYAPAIKESEGRTTNEVESLAPGLLHLFTRFQRDGWATAARGEITDDAEHYASTFHREYRSKVDCDDYVMSVRHVDVPGRIEVLTIDRPFGASRFGPREVALVKLVHDEVAPLVGVRLATEDHLTQDGLSKRLRQVLAALLRGESEKAIALQLGLSNSTIHEYVGMLLRHFRVHTRAALMAYFIRRSPELIMRAPARQDAS